MTNISLRKKDFEFMRILGNREISLGKIGSKLRLDKYKIQRIFNNLEKADMIISRKEGRRRFVKLNKNGKYFNEFYKRQRDKRK